MEIIFEKSRKNLKLIQNRLAYSSPGKQLNRTDVLFLAVGGYKYTFDLLLEMGLEPEDIAVFDSLKLSRDFCEQSHGKEVIYISNYNYMTSSAYYGDVSRKRFDRKVADQTENEMNIYQKASKDLKRGKDKIAWVKPSVVILDDPTLNLQFDNNKFENILNFGFVQMSHRNADPKEILEEIKGVEEADHLMFAKYQDIVIDEKQIRDILDRLQDQVSRTKDGVDYFYPTEFKKIVGSKKMADELIERENLPISKLKKNARFNGSGPSARWVKIKHEAYDFNGYDYKDEEELFLEELEAEEQRDREYAREQEEKLEAILAEKVHLNITLGYQGKGLGNSGEETLKHFVDSVDQVEEQSKAVNALARTKDADEYKNIKKTSVVYFLDGRYKNDERLDANYLGGKKLIPIDVDDQDYTREELEEKLEENGYFGMIYPTARYYYDGSLRWRIVLLADEEFTKESYKHTVKGLGDLLDLDIDEASAKLSQLAGYPFVKEDVSFVVGSKVNVKQFQPKEKPKNVVDYPKSGAIRKQLIDFDHPQAKDLKRALTEGIQEGERNNVYFGIMQFLYDTLDDPQWSAVHDEARSYIESVKDQMIQDGLSEKEVETICRRNSQKKL